MPPIKTYPQFLLLGDSIIQFGAFLRDGVSFTAGLEERKSPFSILHFRSSLPSHMFTPFPSATPIYYPSSHL
jgi:hypothetical protein